MNWLLVYKRNENNVVITIRIKSQKHLKSEFLFPMMRKWAYEWLHHEIPLHEIEIY